MRLIYACSVIPQSFFPVECDFLFGVIGEQGLEEVDAVEKDSGFLVTLPCQLELCEGLLVVAYVDEQLYEQQVAVAEEKVVVGFIEDRYCLFHFIVAVEVLSEPVVVSCQLVVYSCGIIRILHRIGVFERFFEHWQAKRWLGIHLCGSHPPIYGPCFKLPVVAFLGDAVEFVEPRRVYALPFVVVVGSVDFNSYLVKLLVDRGEVVFAFCQ